MKWRMVAVACVCTVSTAIFTSHLFRSQKHQQALQRQQCPTAVVPIAQQERTHVARQAQLTTTPTAAAAAAAAAPTVAAVETTHNTSVAIKTASPLGGGIGNTVPMTHTFDNTLLLTVMVAFHRYIAQNDFSCYDSIRPGLPDVGGYEICMVPGVALIPENCLVYSFGVNFEWSFIDELSEKYDCHVHAYDPAMNELDHDRNERLRYHNTGVWDGVVTNNLGWDMKDLATILRENKHENSTIDVIKFDTTDGSEWPSLVDWLKTGVLVRVKQLILTVHTPKFRLLEQRMTLDDHLRVMWIFEELARQGFRRYLIDAGKACCDIYADWSCNENSRVLCCYELYYINSKFLTS